MKTIFYNTLTEELGKARATPYTVDGQPGILPENIIELEVIEAERPVISELETAAMEWVIDLPMNQYRQEWTVRDLTEEEIIQRRNLEADMMDENIPLSLVRQILKKKVEVEATAEEDLLQYAELFPAYRVKKAYEAGERFYYEGQLYNVVQGHTSQFDWRPDELPALYTQILPAGQIGEWVQPLSTNPYQIGDKVTHNGFTWESTAANNVWEPGVYGWVKI